jgi:ribonuclease Z
MLEFTFLGTSAGVPTGTRNVSALAVKAATAGKDWFLIDAGEATQHRLLSSSLSFQNLALIMITHAHGDHCFGLPGLLTSMSMNQRQNPLTLWAPQAVIEWVRSTMDCTDSHVSYAVDFVATEHVKTLAWSDAITFHAHPLRHRVVTHAFEIELLFQKRHLHHAELRARNIPQGPLWHALQQGQDVAVGGQTIAADAVSTLEEQRYRAICGGDNGDPQVLAHVAGQLDVLIHEGTFSQKTAEKVGPDWMHSSVTQVARFAAEHRIPNLVLTHFSPRYHAAEMAALETEARQFYPGQLFLAADGKTYRLDNTRALQIKGSNHCANN